MSRSFLAALMMVATLLAGGAPAAQAENEGVAWLMREPVTLLDLGMIRLRGDLEEAAERIHEKGLTPLKPSVGTYYEGRSERIIAYVAVRERFQRPAPERCREMFGRVVRHLLSKAPGDNGRPEWYLEALFAHEGAGNFGKPRSLADDLMRAVQLEISVLPPDPMRDSTKVLCTGRLDTELGDLAYTTS